MDDIEDLILDAWERVKPRLMEDAAELKRRLARRNSRSLSRPPRAWCLAVRASNRRLAAYGYGARSLRNCHPSTTSDSSDPSPTDHRPLTTDHSVFLDFNILHDLCRPIKIAWGGDTWDEVAKSLGVGFTGLIHARISGKFQTRHVAGLEGRFGPPVPILSCDEALDPNARGFATPDQAWGVSGSFNHKRIPFDFQQCLTRVPVYHASLARRHYDDTMHPEMRDSPSSKPRLRLPPPAPDSVWYKWSKSGVYLGDDPKYWRKTPQDPGTPPPPAGVLERKPKRKPREKLMRGSLVFRGWMWVCPQCGKQVRTVYLPLKAMNLLVGEIDELPVVSCQLPEKEAPPSELATGNWALATSFACYSCHRIRAFSRIDSRNSWNELVGYLSGGLLYGYEVQKPDGFDCDEQRKREYRPRARPAPRREQVLRRILNGWTITQIATDLKMCKQQVCDCIRKLCRQEGVANRRELASKLGSPHFQPLDSDRIHRESTSVDHAAPPR